MEPPDSIQISLRKVVSMRVEAEAAPVDLTRSDADPRFGAMPDRVRQSLHEPRLAAKRFEP